MKYMIVTILALTAGASTSFADPQQELPGRYIAKDGDCDGRYVEINDKNNAFSFEKVCQRVDITDEYIAPIGQNCRNDGKEFIRKDGSYSMNAKCIKLETAKEYTASPGLKCATNFLPLGGSIVQPLCKRADLIDNYPIAVFEECADGFTQVTTRDFTGKATCKRTKPLEANDPVLAALVQSVRSFTKQDCRLALRWRSQLTAIMNENSTYRSEIEAASQNRRGLDEAAWNCPGYQAVLSGPKITAPGYNVNGQMNYGGSTYGGAIK